MKKLLTAIASTVALNLGVAGTAPAFFLPPPPPPPPPPSLPGLPIPPLFNPPDAGTSEISGAEYCKTDVMKAANIVGPKGIQQCVASTPGQVWSVFSGYLTGNVQPVIEAAICVKNNYPTEYSNAVAQAVTFEGECKVYGE